MEGPEVVVDLVLWGRCLRGFLTPVAEPRPVVLEEDGPCPGGGCPLGQSQTLVPDAGGGVQPR